MRIYKYYELFSFLFSKCALCNSAAQLFSNCAELRAIFRSYRARDCAQVKFTCVGNPKQKISVFNIFSTRILIMNVKLS